MVPRNTTNTTWTAAVGEQNATSSNANFRLNTVNWSDRDTT